MRVKNANSHYFLIKLTPRIGRYWASTVPYYELKSLRFPCYKTNPTRDIYRQDCVTRYKHYGIPLLWCVPLAHGKGHKTHSKSFTMCHTRERSAGKADFAMGLFFWTRGKGFAVCFSGHCKKKVVTLTATGRGDLCRVPEPKHTVKDDLFAVCHLKSTWQRIRVVHWLGTKSFP